LGEVEQLLNSSEFKKIFSEDDRLGDLRIERVDKELKDGEETKDVDIVEIGDALNCYIFILMS